jgi:uncharacterized cofD-like protein
MGDNKGGWVTAESTVQNLLASTADGQFGPLDLLPGGELSEKLIALALCGPPKAPAAISAPLCQLSKSLNSTETSEVKVVVFGGGTGLSNLIGGDSRNSLWPRAPFHGLKEVFPKTKSVVCVTDDGGSTGEILKDLPVIALGDLRHVLLSSIRERKLQKQYGLDELEAASVATILHRLFNYRFADQPRSVVSLIDGAEVNLDELPGFMARTLYWLLDQLFTNANLRGQLSRPHCLGNLILAAAIYQHVPGQSHSAGGDLGGDILLQGLNFLTDLIGADSDSVLPCTTTPAHLKILYDNGVLVSGEFKSGHARRSYPMDRVFVEFAAEPQVPKQVIDAIDEADIILFAPGSLFTSIVPIMQVPGIAEAVRRNRQALKILVANLWAQKGETDIAMGDLPRRFYVSDLIAAYHRNIPGGVIDLFEQVLILGQRDIPGSILQNYALENKVPIYLDRDKVKEMGFAPVEAKLYSQADIDERRVIQHDPSAVAAALRAMWSMRAVLVEKHNKKLPLPHHFHELLINKQNQTPSQRFAEIKDILSRLDISEEMLPTLGDILWRHWDIPVEHLANISGVKFLDQDEWARCQEWDNIFSFYDPQDRVIKIHRDVEDDPARFEIGFLVALGQSLLGDYAASKDKAPIEDGGEFLGYQFRLTLTPEAQRHCYFNTEELHRYLRLVRMHRSEKNNLVYTRLINSDEGFTPPGLLFGLTYAWYLDNRFAIHIEYKMAISKTKPCNLIPEQKKIAGRRQSMTDFFRTKVFRYSDPQFQPGG